MSCDDLPEEERERLSFEPRCLDIAIVWGTNNTLTAYINDGAGRGIDITADTVTFIVKDSVGGGVQISKSNGPGNHSAPALGETVFKIVPADTATAGATTSTYWTYEIRRIAATLEETVHIHGNFIVRPTI